MNLEDIAVAAIGAGWNIPVFGFHRDQVDKEGFAAFHGHAGCIHISYASTSAIVVLETDTTIEENNPGDPEAEGDNRIDPTVNVTAVIFFSHTEPIAVAHSTRILDSLFAATKDLTR